MTVGECYKLGARVRNSRKPGLADERDVISVVEKLNVALYGGCIGVLVQLEELQFSDPAFEPGF